MTDEEKKIKIEAIMKDYRMKLKAIRDRRDGIIASLRESVKSYNLEQLKKSILDR